VTVSVPGSLFIWSLCFQSKFVHLRRNFCGQSEPRTLLAPWNLEGVFLLHYCMQVVHKETSVDFVNMCFLALLYYCGVPGGALGCER
jgi:hypothetical protein